MNLFEGAEMEDARRLEATHAHTETTTPVGASPIDTEPTTTATPSVDLSDDIHGEARDRIFFREDGYKTLHWSFTDGVVPRQLEWRARPNQSSQYERIGYTNISDSTNGVQNPDTPFLHNVSGSYATLVLSALISKGFPSFSRSDEIAARGSLPQDSYLDQEMVIRLNWTSGETEGSSQSGIFSVTSRSSVDSSDLLAKMASWLEDSVARNGNQTTVPNTSSTPTVGGNPGPEGSPGPGGSPGVEGSGSPSSQGTGGSSSGGLSTGAIAGIAVGGGIAFILIVAGLFWLLRRRRRQKMQETAYAPKQKTSSAYMEGKELHAQHAADSPRSPLSEDDHAPQIGTGPVPSSHSRGGMSHGATDNAGYAPYQADTAGSRDDVSGAADHNGRHAVPSQGVPHAVAHLVEEGMTADEIRRLEEEERQLDAEIERAGGRH